MKRAGPIAAGIGAALLCAAPMLCAQGGTHPDSTVLRLEGIRVRAIVPITTAGGTSAFEVRIDSLALPAGARLDELLRGVPLLHIRTNSRGESEIVSRGSESRQVAVLLDGIPLTLGWDGRADLGAIAASGPQSVRVLRGLSSVLHGPNALGGVVELTTIDEHGSPPRSLRLTTGFDAEGGYGVSGGVTAPWAARGADWLFRAGGGYRDSPGAPLARGVTEPGDRTAALRLNTDANAVDGFVAGRVRLASGAWLAGSASASRGARGIAAELDVPAPRFWRYPRVDRTFAALSGGTGFHATPFGIGDLEFSAGYDAGRTEIVAFSTRAYDARAGFEDGDDRTLTLRLLGDHTLGRRGDLRAALTLADIRHDEAVPAGTYRYGQRLFSAGAETDWRLADRAGPLRAVRLGFGGAWDAAETTQSGDKPALPGLGDWGARAGLTAASASGRATLHAGLSRRVRFPSLREAYSGALNRFAPNPTLSPERLTAFEAGLTSRVGAGQLQLVGFHHRLDDAIVRVALPDRRFQRVNTSRVRTTGVELLGSQAIGGVLIGADATIQSARLATPHAGTGRLENQPERFGGVHLDVPLPLGLRGFGDALYTGRQHCLTATGEELELRGGTRWNGAVSRELLLRRASAGSFVRRLEARATVDNLTDTATWDQCGLPRPGRLVSVQFRLF
jgi:iron complex outermembrane recepter protein